MCFSVYIEVAIYNQHGLPQKSISDTNGNRGDTGGGLVAKRLLVHIIRMLETAPAIMSFRNLNFFFATKSFQVDQSKCVTRVLAACSHTGMSQT